MKILLTMNLPYFPIYGGANKINRTIAEGLARRGHAVEVVVPALGVPSRLTHAEWLAELASAGVSVVANERHDTFEMEGVTVHAVREPTQLRTALVEQVERFTPDRVILSSEDPSHNLLDALVKVCPERIVYLIHTVSFLPFGPQAFFPSRSRAKLLERIPTIVSISNYVARYIKEWGNLDSTVIYWPTYGTPPFPDLSRFDAGYVTMVNPCAIKGISIFVALARALPEVEFAGVLTWGAVEEDRRALEQLPNVRLLEPSRDIEDILARTRVLLMPSLWEESFGLTAVESMLRGIPVLASDIGGLPEAKLGTDFLLPVRPIERFGERLNENMLPLPVVPEQDVRPWTDALRLLLSERNFYERQSATARDAALKFVSSLSLDPLENLLRETHDARRANAVEHALRRDENGGGREEGLGAPTGAQLPSELAGGLGELTPEQRSLLMLMLREKAAKQADAQPRPQSQKSIRRVPRDGVVPLSFAQQRLWFLDQFEPNSAVYNVPAAVRLTGTLDVSALERSFDEVARRHEILRTRFALKDGQPTQEIAATFKTELPLFDLSALDEAAREEDIRRRSHAAAQQPFDLTRLPLWRTTLLRTSPGEHVLLVVMHHIISDAWSMGILIREVAALYQAYTRGAVSPLPELQIQYADFAHWQHQWLAGDALDRQLSYWREQLRDAPALLELPTDRPRPPVQSYRGGSVAFNLSRELTEGLQRLSRQEGVTLFMTLLAAFQMLLGRYAGTRDVVVGTPIAGRSRAELEGLIGFFVNTLVLRTRFDGDPSFVELLARVREATLGAYEHQDVPFEKLVEELQPAREMSHAPLFQVMFALQNAPRPSLELPGLKLAQVEMDAGTAMFDLSLSVEETPRGLFGVFEYNTDLFDADTIKRLAGHFENLLSSILAEPRGRVSELSLLGTQERRLLLSAWNETAAGYPLDKPLHEFIEAQAERTPERIALFFEDERITYRELNARANRLAHYLRARGVAPETIVGICMERSVEMVVGLLGIMKAGGAYLPLEPEYPKERLAYMLADAEVSVILTQQKFADALPASHDAQIISVEHDAGRIAGQSTENPASGVTAANLVYIIYTSGSTGEPKGAMLAHRGVSNCLLWMQERHRLTAEDRVLLKAPLSFDSSVWELFWPLMVGASVVVARAGEQRDSAYLVDLIARQQVTTVHFVPSMFQVFLEERNVEACDALRHVVCGGEALSVTSLQRFYQRLAGELHNFYGPTETSIGSIDYICSETDLERSVVPIGRPIANTECYLLDEKLEPVPVGVAGELYTGGVGLARGYLKRPALTAEKFIPHPFTRDAGARLYRTGDRARYLPDGNIEFLGRADQQVKLRGLRIELGEIEAALCRHPAVHDAVVVVREDAPGDKRLVAYPVFKPGAAVQASELRLFLKETLPDFMLPSAYVALDKIPLTHNVKIDRRALPAPSSSALRDESETYVAPRTPHELIVASTWAEVLGVEAVGLHDNFFELGGHSLLATQVISRLRENFQIELPLRALFESPTVAELARRAERDGASHAAVLPEIKPVSREGRLPLSFAQQRLWFLDQLVPGSPFYNLPLAVELAGQLDPHTLERTLTEITRRHETLRTSFLSIEGQPVQVVSPARAVEIPLIDLTGMDEDARHAEIKRHVAAEAQAPFDLTGDALLRVKLLRTAPDRHVLLLTMHHIISDAWSMGILIREVAALYQAYTRGALSPLPELQIQYADFAHWQHQWLEGHALEAQLAYWREQLRDAPALLELPTDRPRPPVQSYRGGSVAFNLSRELTEGLQRLSREEGVTLFMTLLAAFQTLLGRYAGTRDVVVGTPIAGRSRAELEGLIGFFVNTLVLRTKFDADATVTELLKRVREVCLGAYAHQDVPFEKLVEELQPAREMSHAPLFQVMFTLQNAFAEEATLPGLELRPLEVESGVAKFDLTLSLSESAAGLWGALEYNTDLFDEATARRMARHFERLLREMVAEPHRRVCELELLDESERRQLIEEWNATGSDYPRETCIHELVERCASRRPDALALVSEDGEWTYDELNRRANKLAHYLRRVGVGRGEVVAVLLERSAEMVLCWLAVLKAGAAYLPLDASYPQERLEMMLTDAGVQTVLTSEQLLPAVAGGVPGVVCVDRDWNLIDGESTSNPACEASADSLAYVIYTSGSTGRPKGILVPHRAVARLVCNTNYVRLDETDRIAQASNASFDAATFEVWGALVSGAQLVFIEREAVLSPARFGAEIRRRGVNVLFLTTALFNLLAREAPDSFGLLKYLLFGGEAVDPARVREVLERARPERLLHVYGPTESTTFASWFPVQDVPAGAWTIPIGRPVSNTQIYILDENFRPVPVGVAGELCLGGDGLAHGYLNSPALTAEKFVPHALSTGAGARLYRTGDRARYLPDGNIEFLGRADRQVKLRGFRIELEEIETALHEHAAVREATVMLRQDSADDKRLVAYLVTNGEVTADLLRADLGRKLPDYMIPTAYVLMDALPLTPNGKVDRRALPPPGESCAASMADFIAPRNTTELRLAQIWEEILGVRPVGVGDNFFALGGHSLLAVRLIARVRKEFQRDLPLDTLFKGATVERLAAIIRQEAAPHWSPLVSIQPAGAQTPLFFVHPAGGNVICYAALARGLGTERPFYALQARGLDGRDEPFARLEEMAAYYIDAVQSAQPAGPYLLGGWSLGGAVAFEMARQMRARGQEVAFLALLDTPAPVRPLEELDEVKLLAELASDLALPISEKDLSQLEPDGRLLHFLEQAQRQRLVPVDYDLAQARRLLHVYQTNVRALSNYRPERCAHRITLFRAAASAAGNLDDAQRSGLDRTLGWASLSTHPVDVHEVPGDHNSMLTEPHVQTLAAQLKRSLSELSAVK